MRVQIVEPRPVPEGYTYIRCDHYSPAQFRQHYTDENGNINIYCLEYMETYPKDIYTISDKIEIREIIRRHRVGSMHNNTGYNTTKRYSYDHDGGRN